MTKMDKPTALSRRAVLMGAGAAATWLASPARALLQAAGRVQVPSLVDPLIARMTLEEKAGQLQLMGKPIKMPVKNGVLLLDLSLPRQAVALLKLDW